MSEEEEISVNVLAKQEGMMDVDDREVAAKMLGHLIWQKMLACTWQPQSQTRSCKSSSSERGFVDHSAAEQRWFGWHSS